MEIGVKLLSGSELLRVESALYGKPAIIRANANRPVKHFIYFFFINPPNISVI